MEREFVWGDESWAATPEGCLWWPRQQALLVADLHLGKDTLFRRAGLPVPEGPLATTLSRLDQALHRTGARRLWILGDLLHARGGRSPRVLEAVRRWRAQHAGVAMTLVRGNHDLQAGDPPQDWDLEVLDPPFTWGSIHCWHEPPATTSTGWHLAGHLHPAVRVPLGGGAVERVSGFWQQPNLMVLPAVGDFTGRATIRLGEQDQFWALIEGEVVEVGELVRRRPHRV